MNNIVSVFIACLVILVGIWLATSVVTLTEQIQVVVLVIASVLALLYATYRKVPLDGKIICMLILGYAFAGKGFAYLTPVEPFYIGEIAWCIGLLGLLYRFTKGVRIRPHGVNLAIFLWMATVGLYLLASFRTYGTLAIRDSAMGYYAMFAFYGYAIFQRNDLDRFFGLVLRLGVVLACLAQVVLISGAYEKIASSEVVARFFHPHPDAILPLVAAGGMYCLLEGIGKRSILRILAGIALVLLLLTSKTAGIFCFAVLLAYMILIGRRVDLILTSSIAVTLAAITVAFVFTLDSHKVDRWIQDNEHLNTFAAGDKGYVDNAATTNWRLAWWEIVYEDTMKEDPVLGTGLGSDLTGHFLQTYMRIDLNSEQARNYARYPHNIILTVFGRMGFIGLAVFLAVMAVLARMHIQVTRYPRYDTADDGRTLLLAQLIVIAGMANGLVQATYEVPYAAITHWFCLGYVISYWQKHRSGHVSPTTAPGAPE